MKNTLFLAKTNIQLNSRQNLLTNIGSNASKLLAILRELISDEGVLIHSKQYIKHIILLYVSLMPRNIIQHAKCTFSIIAKIKCFFFPYKRSTRTPGLIRVTDMKMSLNHIQWIQESNTCYRLICTKQHPFAFSFRISSMLPFFIIEKSEVENYDGRNYGCYFQQFRVNLKQYKCLRLNGQHWLEWEEE